MAGLDDTQLSPFRYVVIHPGDGYPSTNA